MPKCISNTKVIVFDLDDTIGHFEEISIFLFGLQFILGKSHIPDKFLFKLFDLWPKYFRPGIMEIFEIIKAEKQKNKYIKVLIYTNNMGPRSWTLLIKRYIEKKIRYKLFDKVITAYRAHDYGNTRTTHSKTYSDLKKAADYGENANYIFLDDQHHAHMIHSNIRYLHLSAYYYRIPFNIMINSFISSKSGNIIPKNDHCEFHRYMYQYLTAGSKDNRYMVQRSQLSKNKKGKNDIKQFQLIRKEIYKFLNINKTRRNIKLQCRKTRNNRN